MSGPVPSPSMKGMIGFSGTWSLPFRIAIFSPSAGIWSSALDMDWVSWTKGRAGLGVASPKAWLLRVAERQTSISWPLQAGAWHGEGACSGEGPPAPPGDLAGGSSGDHASGERTYPTRSRPDREADDATTHAGARCGS